MPNKNYLRGRRLEWQVKKDYEAAGYKVMRTAGSHGDFDLIAVYEGSLLTGIVFIQCKVVKKTTPGIVASLINEVKNNTTLRNITARTKNNTTINIDVELIIKEHGKRSYEVIPLES